MKKFLKIFSFSLIGILAIILSGCKTSKDDLNSLSQTLSSYYMDINYNHESKSLYAEQTVEYVNTNK